MNTDNSLKHIILGILLVFGQIFILSVKAQEQKVKLYVEMGHSSEIEMMWLKPTGENLISRSVERIIIWELKTSRPLRIIENEQIVGISEDGEFLQTQNYDGFSFWEIKSGKNLFSVSDVEDCSFDLSVKSVVCSRENGVVETRNIFTGDIKKQFTLPENRIQSFAFGFGETIITTSGNDRTAFLRIWKDNQIEYYISDIKSWGVSRKGKFMFALDNAKKLSVINIAENYKIILSKDAVENFTSSSDGKYIGILGDDKKLTVWDLVARKIILTLNNQDSFDNLNFSPDDRYIIYKENDNFVIYDPEKFRQIFTIPIEESYYEMQFRFNNQVIAIEGIDKMSVWNIETGEKHIFPFDSYGTSFDINGKNVAIQQLIDYNEVIVSLWDMESDQIKKLYTYPNTEKGFALNPPSKFAFQVSTTEAGVQIFQESDNKNSNNYTKEVTEFQNKNVLFSVNGIQLIYGGVDGRVHIFDSINGQKISTLETQTSAISGFMFSPDGKTLVINDNEYQSKLWDFENGQFKKDYISAEDKIENSETPDDKFEVEHKYDDPEGNFILRDKKSNKIILTQKNVFDYKISNDSKTLSLKKYVNESDKTLTQEIWDINTKKVVFKINGVKKDYSETFSPNSEIFSILLSAEDSETSSESDTSQNGKLELWSLKGIKLFESQENLQSYTLDKEWNNLVLEYQEGRLQWYNLQTKTFKQIVHRENYWIPVNEKVIVADPTEKFIAFRNDNPNDGIGIWLWNSQNNLFIECEGHLGEISDIKFSPDSRFLVSGSADGSIKYWDVITGREIFTFVPLEENNWIVTTPDGRFDTNKSLDTIEGLKWQLNDKTSTLLPIDIFLRQYYEPNLLQRVLKCNEQNNCDTEFKSLPSIADINRVQPKIVIKEIKSVKNADSLADVTVEIESVTEDISISATENKKLSSKAFDLRLFRDGQLVGVSAPKDKLEPFIKAAPDLIEQNKEYFKKTGKLTNTPEDVAWREANDIFALTGENVKRITPDKIEYTFTNVKLPKDERKTVEFTAYAFNSDKVKSTTTAPVKFNVPDTISNAPKKGRAFVVSIGVNASENPAYDLKYAANDARKMQEIVGGRLNADGGQFSDVVLIPLISDHDKNKNLSENTASKDVIKGVFSLLAGNEKEVSAEILGRIPNREKIKAVEPEDTLIITYAGHGYADQSGIFYLLPYDIGKDTEKLTTEALRKTISSDELSLWMQDVTAAEMIFIIDACHSSAAVQGDGFKPGPMGSRGLGQLAYDKDMKILSATQANNVALELKSLQQGLLSYALLQDGINDELADLDKDNKLSSAEWLSFAEKRVPELYEEVKDGKREVLINGKPRSGVRITSVKQKSSLNLQQPSLFDFKRRKNDNILFNLP